MATQHAFKTGGIPDPPDSRDYPFFSTNEIDDIMSKVTAAAGAPTSQQTAPQLGKVVPQPASSQGVQAKPSVQPKPVPPKPDPKQVPVPPKPNFVDASGHSQPVTDTKGGQQPPVQPKPNFVDASGHSQPVQPDPKGGKPPVIPPPQPVTPSQPTITPEDYTAPKILAPADAVVLPNLPPVYTQYDIGSCGANAACAALRYAYVKLTGKPYKDYQPSRLFTYYYARIEGKSILMFGGKEEEDVTIDEKIHTDTGSYLRAVMHTFLTYGVCKEELWPYGMPKLVDSPKDNFDTSKKPNPCEPLNLGAAQIQARGTSRPAQGNRDDQAAFLRGDDNHETGKDNMIPRAISYYRVYDPSASGDPSSTQGNAMGGWGHRGSLVNVKLLETVLKRGFPFVFGITFFAGRADLRSNIDENGVFVEPPTDYTGMTQKDVLSHALMAVGFDSTRRLFLVQNSWGREEWPYGCERMKGYCWIPYSWFEKTYPYPPKDDAPAGTAPTTKVLTTDFWVVKFADAPAS